MKKRKLKASFWKNFAVFFTVSSFFVGTLVAAVLIDNDIDGQVKFLTFSEAKIANPDEGEFIIREELIGERKNFTGYVHAQQQPTFDGAFNEQMVAGIADFMGISDNNWNQVPVFISPNSQANSFQGQYLAMQSQNFLVSTIGGFDHIPAVINSLSDSQMKNYGWILMDESFPSSRVASALFQGEQSGFITGVATCLYLNVHYDDYSEDGLKAATYGGRPFDPVVAFLGGFQQGIEYWNNELSKQLPSNISNPVELIDLGDFDSYFVGGFESDRAIAITERMLNLGADAIFPVAGVQTREVVSVVNQRNESTVVIGVDTPMEDNLSFQEINNATKRPTIPFSAVKDFRTMTANIAENIYNRIPGINPENGVAGLGWISVGNVDNNLVSVSKNGDLLLKEYLSFEQMEALKNATAQTKDIFKF